MSVELLRLHLDEANTLAALHAQRPEAEQGRDLLRASRAAIERALRVVDALMKEDE